MLQSPFFLYHHDVGSTGTPQTGTVAITPYELASRLSYFLWNTMPDDTLFARAADGTLTTDSVLTGEVQRMLADGKASATISLFHRQWLDVSELLDQTKDTTVYPRYNAQLGDAMMQELSMYSDYVVRKGDGLLKTLLTSNMSFPQGGLFDLYGVAQPAGFKVGDPVMLDGSQRAGILTQAAFLATHAHRDQTSPVHRGIIVRENMLPGVAHDAPDKPASGEVEGYSSAVSAAPGETIQLFVNVDAPQGELRVELPGKEPRWYRYRHYSVFDDHGKPLYVSGIFTDVTERKNVEAEADAQRKEIAHMMRVAALGELSGGIAHELGQPLTAILANAQAAQATVRSCISRWEASDRPT
jgi:hypothetical protein